MNINQTNYIKMYPLRDRRSLISESETNTVIILLKIRKNIHVEKYLKTY